MASRRSRHDEGENEMQLLSDERPSQRMRLSLSHQDAEIEIDPANLSREDSFCYRPISPSTSKKKKKKR